MTEWHDVLPTVINTFSGKGDGATACFLEFLKVLAEELNEGRKINLSVRSVSTPVVMGSFYWHHTATFPTMIRI